MAELILYKGPNWMDKLSDAQVEGLDVEQKIKYEHRYQPGDIVEIQEDGKWPDRAAQAGVFYYMRVPSLKKAKIDYLATSIVRRKYTSLEELYYSEKVDKDKGLVEMRRREPTEAILAKSLLMSDLLADKPLAHKKRYIVDLSKLTQEEMQCFIDGKFLVLNKTRFDELIRDKAI